ncbi:hypothetical protein UFOVP139_30 [uncultured Caudovirales phage]|uniref:PD-(D/E)XK nuclease superfamily n=1 Tax=uncultured Caudovirales phage TaxID=2100421 RepID=A0A6J5LDZ8_9CAUD|nr:hypothetical protein UFOVP139_30 [uncultured Caudovirales phage]
MPIPRAEDELIPRIYASIKKNLDRDFYLSRIGASSIGEECLRKIWLSWRGYDAPDFDGRLLRLFETGNLQEERIINDLRSAGLGVWSHTDEGKQYSFGDETGHFVVKPDGVVKGVPSAEKTPHLLEVKTHNANSFKDLEKKGVAESKPLHYYQIQAGMMYSGVDRGLYVSLCKDNEQYYVQRIKPDEAVQTDIKRKIITLVNAELKPAGISDDASSFGCKFCDMKAVCVGDKQPLVNCRTCENSTPFENGAWVCQMNSATIPLDVQVKGCDSYKEKGL